MKFSSSSSSTAPSPSSTTSTDGGLRNSRSPAASCFGGILRCLVCGSVSSRPSNVIEEADGGDISPCQDRVVEEKVRPSSPSIVARLMGLESMPEFGSVALARNSNSIVRSRSVNSLNSWLEFDPAKAVHRGVRTSLSFREIPTFLRQENPDFILLCFGSDDGENPKMSRSKELKSDKYYGELKQRKLESSTSKLKEKRKEKRADKKDERCDRRVPHRKSMSEIKIETMPSRTRRTRNSIETRASPKRKDIFAKPFSVSKIENSSKPTNYKEIADIVKLTKRRSVVSSDETVTSECSSENSSPVSVLDQPFDTESDSLIDSEIHTISDDQSVTPLNSRRKLSSVSLNSDSPSSHISCIPIWNDIELDPRNDDVGERRKTNYNLPNCSVIWMEICQMVEKEVKKCNWVPTNLSKMEDFEEIGVEFAVEILECLLQESIAELAIV